MKKLYIFFLSWFMVLITVAQQKKLIVEQEAGKLFLRHSVAPKENWYSIGRIYNISPKEIAPYNNTTINKGLAIGESLKIPLNAANFLQSGQPGSDEVLVPLHHPVKEKEGLYRIGQTYNKVSSEQLKSWNKLSSDELTNGMNLIVGYLKVKKDQSPLAKGGQVSAPVTVVQPEPKNVEKPKETPPAVSVEKKEPLPPPVRTETPAKPVQTGTLSTGGAFKSMYDDQSKTGGNLQTLNGKAASFKSTSGWKDAKYYVLMNKVQPGVVVKITNTVNGKYVYAKVLGEIPPIKENDGLIIRISNAATTELLMDEGKYEVQINWTKQ